MCWSQDGLNDVTALVKDDGHWATRVNVVQFSGCRGPLAHWKSLDPVGFQPLMNRRCIVIDTLAGKPSFQQALRKDRFWAAKEEHSLAWTNDSFEFDALCDISREAIDKESTLLPSLEHGTTQKSDGYVHRDDLALFNVLIDQVTVLGPWAGPFLPQQVACRQVDKVKFLCKELALGSLACTRSSQHKHDH